MEASDRNKRIHVEGESDFRGWDELIPDVLGLIFKQLSLEEVLQVIPRVCQSWHKLVEGPYYWKMIDIEKWTRLNQNMSEKRGRMLRMLITRSLGSFIELRALSVDDDQMSFIADHAGSLRTLTLKRSSMTDSLVEKVAKNLSSVTTLDLSYPCEISTRALEAIGRNCENLVSMTWNSCHFYSKDMADNEARAISRNMPKLKHLSIANLNIDTPIALEILSGCPQLESLCIIGCLEVDPKLLRKKYPKVEIEGPSDPMGIFDGEESDDGSSLDEGSLSLTSSEDEDDEDDG